MYRIDEAIRHRDSGEVKVSASALEELTSGRSVVVGAGVAYAAGLEVAATDGDSTTLVRVAECRLARAGGRNFRLVLEAGKVTP